MIMKNSIYILFFLLMGYNTYGCDFCNCYLGLNPHYKKNSIGLRYHYMPYQGTQTSPVVLESMGLSKKDFWETRKDVELHAQWYPIQRLQIIASLPYVIDTEGASAKAAAAGGTTHTHSDGSLHVHSAAGETNEGIGDPIVLAHYQLFNRAARDSGKYSQRLLAGAGIKIPLGSYKVAADAEAHEHNHQPGSGSWDLLLSGVYLGKINKMGINLNATYLFANSNSQEFQFGNKLNVNGTIYRELKLKNTLLYPNVGMYYEEAAKDWNKDYYVQNSGGAVTYAHAGMDLYYKKFSVNAAFQLPLERALNGNQAEIKYRLITGLTYAIN